MSDHRSKVRQRSILRLAAIIKLNMTKKEGKKESLYTVYIFEFLCTSYKLSSSIQREQ